MVWHIVMKSKFKDTFGQHVYFSREYGWKKDVEFAESFGSKDEAINCARKTFFKFKDWFVVEKNEEESRIYIGTIKESEDGSYSEIIV